jgi:O-antigen/teichoic acid export membrane protein
MISKSFLQSSIIYTVAGALPMVAGLILLPFYANRLNELHFAQVGFYISISLLLQILFSYSIESYFGIKYTQLSGDATMQKKFIGTISILLLSIGALLLLTASLSGNYIFAKVFKADFQMQFWPYGFYSVLTAFFNSYFKAATNALIYLQKPKLFFTANLMNFVATIGISVGGLILFPDTIVGPMYGRLFSGLLIFLIAQRIYTSSGTFVYEKQFIRELTLFCTPYLFYVISGWILGHIDQYILQSHISKSDLNTYTTALKCFFGVVFIQNSLSAIIFPKLYEIWARQDILQTTKESNRYFNVFTVVNIVQLVLFCIALPLVYKLLIKKEDFFAFENYIGLLASGYALTSILNFYLSTILFTKNTGVLLKIFGISALFQILVTLYFVNRFGLLGAIYAGIITKILQVILSAFLSRKIFIYQYNIFKIIALPFIYIAINILQFHFFSGYSITLYAGQLALFSIVFYFIFKNEIKIVFQQYTTK